MLKTNINQILIIICWPLQKSSQPFIHTPLENVQRRLIHSHATASEYNFRRRFVLLYRFHASFDKLYQLLCDKISAHYYHFPCIQSSPIESARWQASPGTILVQKAYMRSALTTVFPEFLINTRDWPCVMLKISSHHTLKIRIGISQFIDHSWAERYMKVMHIRWFIFTKL